MYSQKKAVLWTTLADEYRPVLAKLTSTKDTMNLLSGGARSLPKATYWIALKDNNSYDWLGIYYGSGTRPNYIYSLLQLADQCSYLIYL